MNAAWIDTAKNLKPHLFRTQKLPVAVSTRLPCSNTFQGWKMDLLRDLGVEETFILETSCDLILEFKNLTVGYVRFEVCSFEGILDSPIHIEIVAGERPLEIAQPFDPHEGILSRTWLQDETITIDRLPFFVCVQRRLAFVYLKLRLNDCGPQSKVLIRNLRCDEVSSVPNVDDSFLDKTIPKWMQQLCEVSLRTLRLCMQDVFEDGPKRDRRLWLGDLRLQALANSVSFKNYDLVKRCLYLFAGFQREDGTVPACIYDKSDFQAGGEFILDYSVLFGSTLLDYTLHSGDESAARQLWPVACEQIRFALQFLDESNVFQDPGNLWIFIDWNDRLHKQSAMHAILIYGISQVIELANLLGKEVPEFIVHRDCMRRAAREHLRDRKTACYFSGPDRQISWATQAWMILADVSEGQEAHDLWKALELTSENAILPNSPYLYHFVVEAMIKSNQISLARDLLQNYWGGMISNGATTFWEVYNPSDPMLSPYGNAMVNSYCHAWSCTPIYFIHKYPQLVSEG